MYSYYHDCLQDFHVKMFMTRIQLFVQKLGNVQVENVWHHLKDHVASVLHLALLMILIRLLLPQSPALDLSTHKLIATRLTHLYNLIANLQMIT